MYYLFFLSLIISVFFSFLKDNLVRMLFFPFLDQYMKDNCIHLVNFTF